ncbi:MAG TPA: tetratricopeptide repeat protein [Verrucomicrobiae bacterium]|jgi:tetratricopeptide (TPR) repeat protein
MNPSSMPINADDVFRALPPPPDWPELAKAIASRPMPKGNGESVEYGLQLLASALTGEAEARKRVIVAIQAKAKDGGVQSAVVYGSLLQQISQAVLAASNDPETIVRTLERQLDPNTTGMMPQLQVPNLIAQVGREKAEAFLRRLTNSNAQLTFNSRNETQRLAQKLAVELIDQLRTPQWGLVDSLDSVPLYEALDKRFSKQTNAPATLPGMPEVEIPPENAGLGMDQKINAQVYYMLGLIAENRSKDAVAVATKIGGNRGMFLPEDAFKAMERAGYTSALDNFFFDLLSQNPTLSFWDQYVPIAAKAGETDRMVSLARASAGRADLSDVKKASIHQVLFKALLAADQVDEGVEEMRKLMASDASPSTPYNNSINKGELGVMLAQIGVLLKKPEWSDEGVAAVKKWFSNSSNADQFNIWQTGGIAHSITEVLIKLQKGPDAEALLADALANAVRISHAQRQYYGSPTIEQQLLTEMAALYHRAGREEDILALLTQSPDWGAADLSDLGNANFAISEGFSLESMHVGMSSQPIEYLAASALMAAGKNDQVAKIVDDLLNRQPGLDRGYELLIALKGRDALPRLEQLFSRDSFEERPLIWKAHLLRQQNKLQEAEKAVRQAIAIDPSDGEEGRGDRMRAYAELADILEAGGDKKNADFYRQVVTAIRVSEDADQYYAAGLLKRAISMYEDGLSHFADAYCIQSRLAVQLASLGQNKEAEEHYRRAYELMPDSFGRVESHCFGCERVFEGEQSQGIAERVFTKLVAERPDKPQVHYLLGYLREEEERFNEARTNYEAAVRLDPDYLNAWGKLEGISEHVMMDSKEHDDIVFNLLRLDPLQRHHHHVFTQASDLTGLWNAVEAAAQRRLPIATNLMALTASKIALDKTKSSAPAGYEEMLMQSQNQLERQSLTGGDAVAQTAFVRIAGQLLFNGVMSIEE